MTIGSVSLGSLRVNEKATFSFKDPFNVFVKDFLQLNEDNILLEVSSILSMRDHIKLSMRDPYADVYKPVGLSQIKYKEDLDENVHLITFTYLDEYNLERIFRVPLTYILEVSDASSIPYVNHGIYLGLEAMPLEMDLTYLEKDLIEFVKGRVGCGVTFTHVVNDNVLDVTSEEHERLSKVRKNSLTINKTYEVRAIEAEEKLNAILKRLDELGIQLWEDKK